MPTPDQDGSYSAAWRKRYGEVKREPNIPAWSLPNNRAAIREQAIAKLIELQRDGDPESAHLCADNVLCDLLVLLGYEDVVAEWLKVEKWYA